MNWYPGAVRHPVGRRDVRVSNRPLELRWSVRGLIAATSLLPSGLPLHSFTCPMAAGCVCPGVRAHAITVNALPRGRPGPESREVPRRLAGDFGGLQCLWRSCFRSIGGRAFRPMVVGQCRVASRIDAGWGSLTARGCGVTSFPDLDCAAPGPLRWQQPSLAGQWRLAGWPAGGVVGGRS